MTKVFIRRFHVWHPLTERFQIYQVRAEVIKRLPDIKRSRII